MLGSLMSAIMIPLNTFQVAYINDTLQLDVTALSTASIAMLLGFSISSYIFPILNKKLSRYILFLIGWIGCIFTYAVLTFISPALPTPLLWILLISVFFISGCLVSLIGISVNVAFMSHVETQYLARTGSIFNALCMSTTPIASFIFAGVASFLSINQIFLFTSIGGMLILIPILLNRTLKQL